MTIDSPPVSNTLSQIQRNSAHTDLQQIAADYYNITSADGKPLAGLLVLLDRRQRPVRAELHLPIGTYEQQEVAQRQAQLLLTDRYHGEGTLTLNVLYVQIDFDRLSVPLSPPPPSGASPIWLRPLALGLVAVIILVAAGWFLNDLFTRGEAVATSDAAPALVEGNTAGSAEDEATGAGAQSAAAETPFSLISATNGLPESRNAIPLQVGQRVQVRAGSGYQVQVTLRTEPGASAGEVIDYIYEGDQATIINGPVWLEGTSDTIVWWLVQLDDGRQAWAPANTSELTTLEPAP